MCLFQWVCFILTEETLNIFLSILFSLPDALCNLEHGRGDCLQLAVLPSVSPRSISMWTGVEAGIFHQQFLDRYSFEESVHMMLSQVPVPP